MRYIEDVHWILDKPGTTIHNQDEQFRENIAFVHSLGKKCDCVGWSNLRRDDPQAEEILEKIVDFCKENGWTARGLYNREYADFQTDWYRIDGSEFKISTVSDSTEISVPNGYPLRLCSIKAYRELIASPKTWGRTMYVPERFRSAYLEAGLEGLDFFWAKDTGKYAAEQYFTVYGTRRIPRVAVDWGLEKRDLRNLGPSSGWLPRLGEVFHAWTQINLPYCYKKEDMPNGGIAYAYVPSTFHCCGMYQVLVHKDVAQVLLAKKAIPATALKPVPVLEELPAGYTLRSTTDYPRPDREYMYQSLRDYTALKTKVRPLWQVSEKDALKLLRKAKADRKEDFGKKLSKATAEALAGTPLAPMLPYYLVADRGYLSDEYRLLSPTQTKAETEAFYALLEKEELLEQKPEGTVICTCADGDWVLLLRDGTVIRFSHEMPESTEQWPSLAQFIVDAIND